MRKTRVFRDPVHGLIELADRDRRLLEIIDTAAFQRLRRIHQLGVAGRVYPAAARARFGHAPGAYHGGRRITGGLGLDEPVATHVRAAALVHDIGHGPFSHAWEQAFEHSDSHEQWTGRIVAEDPQLSAALARIEPGLPATLNRFWAKTYRPVYARKLVSSQLDCDRLDYLLRDGHYSGAGYATYDLDWILYALRIDDVGDDREDLVVDYGRGMHAVEQYLFARSYMYAQVYHHKTVRAAEWMFLKLMRRFAELARGGAEPPGLAAGGRLARGEPLEVPAYLRLDDGAVHAAIGQWAADHDDAVLSDLAHRLIERRLFKTIELGNDPAVVDRVHDRAEAIARDRFGDDAPYYLQLDRAEQIGYSAGAAAEQLWVVGHPERGTVSLGDLLSDMRLARLVSRVRIVCAPELVQSLSAALPGA